MENAFELSAVICTHNPRADYLRRVLDALAGQTLPCHQWQLLLIDNASGRALAESWDLSWHPHSRIIREDQLGLTPARLRGIREAMTDLLVFSDDDTVFNPNYLAEALRIAHEWPMLGAWGGQPMPEFETPPPEWSKPYLSMLGLCQTARDFWSNNYHGNACPIGAGLCIRREVALQYAACLSHSSGRLHLDRTGKLLLAGGDTDMAFTACDMGMGIGRFVSLGFLHLIPSRRLELQYLLAMREGMVYSDLILDSYRRQRFPLKPFARSLFGYVWRILRGDFHERKFQLAALRGEFKARRQLAHSTPTPLTNDASRM